MPEIELTASAKAYLDEFREEASTTETPLSYSEAVSELQHRSWNAAYGGGKERLDADDLDIDAQASSLCEDAGNEDDAAGVVRDATEADGNDSSSE